MLTADFAAACIDFDAMSVRTNVAGIGGAGLSDGLVLGPIGAALITGLTKSLVKRGHNISFLLGRKRMPAQRGFK
jgi:hypothetical protein